MLYSYLKEMTPFSEWVLMCFRLKPLYSTDVVMHDNIMSIWTAYDDIHMIAWVVTYNVKVFIYCMYVYVCT